MSLAGTQINAGFELASQRVTLRIVGTQMAVITHDGTLVRTLPARSRPGSGTPSAASGERPYFRLRPPVTVQRRPPSAARSWSRAENPRRHDPRPQGRHRHRQRPQLPAQHRQTVATVARTSSSQIHRYKAYATPPGMQP